MNILVTGVAGFMGSHLSEFLADIGHSVIGIDNLSIGIKENIPSNIKFYKADLTNFSEINSILKEEKPELIYHLAAWAHEGLSQFMPRLITENNYNAFLNLITSGINNGMKRIVVTSSMSVYGEQEPPFDETMPVAPADIYAVAKASMEKTTEILADVFNFDYTIVRPHNVYGPKQMLHDPYRNVIGIFMNRAMKGQEPIIYGDGKQTRAFSYIDDVTPYMAKCGFLEETKGETINIGPLEEYSVNRLAECIIKEFDISKEPTHVEDRPREVKHAYCTNTKAQKILGYKTSISFEEGIHRMAEWAKKQGPQEFKYLDSMELVGDKIPTTWKNKTI